MATEAKSSQRVMIIDDDEMVATTLRTVLSRYYANVHICLSATQSVLDVRKFKPDVIVCDIRMPDHDGFWVLAEIRKFNKTVPVIFNSAYQDATPREDVEVVYQPFAYLSKGGGLGQFLNTVQGALKSVA